MIHLAMIERIGQNVEKNGEIMKSQGNKRIIKKVQKKPANKPFPFLLGQSNILFDPTNSKAERFIEKASGSFGRAFKLIFFIAGLIAFISIFPPFLRFLFEFSKWSFKKIGLIFP